MAPIPEELASLYADLDHAPPSEVGTGVFANRFVVLRDHFRESGETEWSNDAQTEVAAFSCSLRAGELIPYYSFGAATFPNDDSFADEAREHLSARIDASSSSPVKARYAHILWKHPKAKHQRFAAIAVKGYLECFRDCLALLSQKLNNDAVDVAHECLLAAIRIASESGIDAKEVHEAISHGMTAAFYDFDNQWAFRWRFLQGLREIKFAKRTETVKGILEQLAREYDQVVGRLHGFSAHDIADVAVELSETIQLPSKSWLSRRGAAALQNMDVMGGKTTLAGLSWLQQAIQDFQAAGERETVNRLLIEHEASAGKMHYGRISTPVDMTDTYNQFSVVGRSLIEKGPEAILKYLAFEGEPLVPSIASVREQAKQFCEESPILGVATHQIQDQFGRPSKIHVGAEGSLEHWTNTFYGWRISGYTQELLKRILLPAIQGNVLTSGVLSQWLESNSWLGLSMPRPLGNGETLNYRWVELILPAFGNYEHQLHRYFITQGELPSLLLSVDSLALKMEGIIRDLLRLWGSATTQAKAKRDQRTIEDRALDSLLSDSILVERMGEDDAFLLRFILTEKGGWNLRSDIAHSHLALHQYTVHQFHLLLLLALRLSRFQFESVEVSESDVAQETPDS